MDRHIYALDKIEEEIATLENIDTKEKIELNIKFLPQPLKEGSILKKINDTYYLDKDEEEKRRREILERFKKLRKNHELND